MFLESLTTVEFFISTRNHKLSTRKCFCSIGFSPGIRVSSFCFFFHIFYY
ncbi:hypothetical protein BDC45DRAFT_519534 [Circinella umbellata]|nr:hypothetical protein BDC45DRAFT_519534 [Circinella umbellata]